ncbi:hypothetical protein ALON55S_08684 [Alishewanella longhuensis]
MSELATTASAQTNPLLSFTDLPPFSAYSARAYQTCSRAGYCHCTGGGRAGSGGHRC